jgi:hypothetical protein
MHFLILIYEDEKHYGDTRNNQGMSHIFSQHMALGAEMGPRRLAGAGLKTTDMATTVRTVGGKKTVHDGPFAETKEQLGGYYLIDVPTLDEAIAIAKKVPLLKDGSVEVRPLMSEPTK